MTSSSRSFKKAELKSDMVNAINYICRLEALEQGFRCLVVRGPVHCTYTVRDPTTKRITGHKPVDEKLTVFVGESWPACQSQGHIYVVTEQHGLPVQRIREPETSKLIAPGCKPAGTDFWLLRGQYMRPSWGPDACPLKVGER
ncbi:hypothetical protein N657DRAFT_121991 [Parathielavia appendiculata]|uniref:Uncharacterized protein n=1 Tax=Parathielavia appendiculata TaxID=2587402 RepID=A0AAN6TW19_9PEZI|nr:hypothetical protein N657DRAFT_121991 [Parathielavia appendiculata]